jgi:hypothetical protein
MFKLKFYFSILFTYFGHGSRSQYYDDKFIENLKLKACSILIGCSSGNQYIAGSLSQTGQF